MRVGTVEDIEQIEAVLNHPTCRQWMGPGFRDLHVDPMSFVDNVTLLVQDGEKTEGVIFFEHIGIGVYAALVAMTGQARGLVSVAEGKKALRYLFTATDAITVMGTIDSGNQGGCRMALAMGLTMDYVYGSRLVCRLGLDQFCMTDREFIRVGKEVLAASDIPCESTEEAGMIGFLKVADEWANTQKGMLAFNAWALLCHMPEVVPMSENLSSFSYRGKELVLQAVHSGVL